LLLLMSSNKLISILILLGLFLNHWILEPLIHLADGQISILRITLIWIIDILCIAAGAILIIKSKPRFPSPKKVVFGGIMFILMLLLMECTLQVIVRISPSLDRMLSPETATQSIQHIVPDPQLGYRGNPDLPGHDSSGFRNKTALSNASIVAIGDSQTYGTGVKCEQAWPQQLGTLSGRSVYNMSLGGYGSVHGLILMETEALQLNPKHTIFMMYDGNDAFDAYDAVYNHNLYDTFKSTDSQSPGISEQQNPLAANIQKTTSRVWADDPVEATHSRAIFSKLKLYQLITSLKKAVRTALINQNKQTSPKIAQHTNDPNFIFFEDFSCNDFQTTVTPRYRMLGMNIKDSRIQEGLRIHLEAIRKMKQLADSKSIDFLVLLLPTKEVCFYDLHSQYSLDPSEAIQSTVKLNDKIRNLTIEYLKQHDISYIDTLPILKRCFEQKRQPFFENADGHLNSIGHEAIAKIVHEYIESASNKP